MPYGSEYLGYGASALPALSVNPIGLGIDQAKGIEEQQEGALQLQQDQALAPLELAAKKQELQNQQQLSPLEFAAQKQQLQQGTYAGKQAYANSQIAEVARQASAADPADAPGVWDRGMHVLQDQGIDLAGQYVGHYRPDLAERVMDVFGTQPSERAGRAQADSLAPDPAILVQKLSALPQPALQQMVERQNKLIAGFNRLSQNYTQENWNAELQNARDMGVPIDALMPSTDFNVLNYGILNKRVQEMTQVRDAGANMLISASMGAPIVPPAMSGAQNFGIAGYDANGAPIYYNRRNPGVTMAGPPGLQKTPGGPAAVQLLDAKRNMWLSIHPGDEQGALDYMQGKRSPSGPDLENMALTRANQELGDAVLAGAQIDNPDQWVRDRASQNYQLLTGAGKPQGVTGAPGAQGTPGTKPPVRGPRYADGTAMSQKDVQASLAAARNAIKRGAPRAGVIQRLQAQGLPFQGL